MSGVVIAAFRTWRDQKRLTEAAELELQEATKTHAEEKRQMERALKTSEGEHAERFAAQEKAHAEEKAKLESERRVLEGQLASERAQRAAEDAQRMKKMEAEPISTHPRRMP
jgi:tRNA G10  N-methylase Trm11